MTYFRELHDAHRCLPVAYITRVIVVWKRPVRSSGGRETSLSDPFFVSLSFVRSIRFLLQNPEVLSPSQESLHVTETEAITRHLFLS